MGDYKYVGAPPGMITTDPVTCCFCNATKIGRGDPYYYEAENRKPICRPCARLIKEHGEKKAKTKVGSFANLFKELFGAGNPFEGL